MRDAFVNPKTGKAGWREKQPAEQASRCRPAHGSPAATGIAYSSAAETCVQIKGIRLKLLWAAICPWKRDIRIHTPAAAIFICAPPQENDQTEPRRGNAD